MENLDLSPWIIVIVLGVAVLKLAVPAVVLAASLLAVRTAPPWVATCMVGGSALNVLVALPSILIAIPGRIGLTAADVARIYSWTGVIGTIAGLMFAVGLLGYVLFRRSHLT